MGVFFYLEAGQARRNCYRFGLGCEVSAQLASVIAALTRLFT
jgi:hypothetical protein